jgi:hypothetical protein
MTEHTRKIRNKLPVSTIGSERFYCMLTRDCEIEINGVNMSRVVFVYDSGTVATPIQRSPVAEFQQPSIQVMHSFPQNTEPITQTMRPVPSVITQDNNKVYETPAIKSRHIDPNTSPRRRRPEASPIKQRIQPGLQETTELDLTESESEDPFIPTAPLETPMDADMPERIESTPEKEISTSRHATAPVADMGTMSPLDNPPKDDLDLDEGAPDSLPVAFKAVAEKTKYEEEKKLKTPARQYGKKGAKPKKAATETPAPRSDTEDSAAPLTTVQKKGTKRKATTVEVWISSEGKEDEGVTGTTKKKRKGKAGTPIPSAAEEEEEELPAPKPTKKGKKKAPEPAPETEDEQPFSTAPQESPAVSAEEKPRKKAPTKAAKSAPNDTQYTFPGSEQEEDGTPVKTPKARGKAAPKTPATKKTPATTARKKATPRTRSTTPHPATSLPPPTLRTTDHYEGSPPRISFSSSHLIDDKATQKFIRSNSGKALPSPAEASCNFLVVGELKRTPKFIIAVARGIRIVEEAWLKDSVSAGYFVDPDPYVPNDPEREAEWGATLSDALARGVKGETQVLKGLTVYLTPSLIAHLKALKSEEGLVGMLKAAGAEAVHKKAPRGGVEEDTLVLGKEDGEKDLAALEKAGWKVYGTGIIGLSVMRGALETGDEFLVKPGTATAAAPAEKKGRGGKRSLA